ncbi:MAG TPA: DMT family transporter [Hyphomicrobiaceae bacterium]|nr:DMT family transporter [Hyphomicrobiaceae bacterium]
MQNLIAFLRSATAAYVLLPVAAACWAGNHIVARAIGGYVPAASLSLVRWLLVALVIALCAGRHVIRDWPALRQRLPVMLFLALMGGSIFGTMQYVTLQYTTALNMGVVGSISPVFIVAASWLLFGDRLGAIQLFGVFVSLTGVLAIMSQLSLQRLFDLSFNFGDLLIIVNMVFWAIYCACLRLRPNVHAMSFLFVFALASALFVLPFAIWEFALGRHLLFEPLTVFAVVYAALVTSLLAYVAWNRGIELVGASRASAFLHTIPLFAAVFATSLLGERLYPFHVVGFALILAGVTLAARPNAKLAQAD